MRGPTWLTAIVLIGGCDIVWRVDEFHEFHDAMPGDAFIVPMDASIDAPPGCTLMDVGVPVADAFLSQSAALINEGGADVIIVDDDAAIRGLWKFTLPETIASVRYVSWELVLPVATQGPECSIGPVGTCSDVCTDLAGGLIVHAAVSDWAEGQVSWTMKTAATMWTQGGAAMGGSAPGSGVDRSSTSAAITHPAGTDADFMISGPTLDSFVPFVTTQKEISFLAVGKQNGVFHARARDYHCPNNGMRPPKLLLTYCP